MDGIMQIKDQFRVANMTLQTEEEFEDYVEEQEEETKQEEEASTVIKVDIEASDSEEEENVWLGLD